ncbi:MAG: L-2-hydroxyglutarate oxidase [Homoserinimonas sp.]
MKDSSPRIRRARRIGIVGGGIIGISIARALCMTARDHVTVIEKEPRVAAHQTGHNSGVVHAGIYYEPGSLKARLCAIGRERTQQFCEEKGLPYRELGKIVVATSEEQLSRLYALETRAAANSVPGLRRLNASELLEIEPHSAGIAALHSPRTAVVDYTAITEAMARDVLEAGGAIHLGEEVTGIRRQSRGVDVVTTMNDYSFDKLIVCAGLQADLVGGMAGADRSPKILPFRGEYWDISPERAHLVRGMIYPVPNPNFPFLGVHFTRGVYEQVHVGPNAVPALAREGYSWNEISLRDTAGSLFWPGAGPLLAKHWRMGMREISASLVKPLYSRAAQQFIPEVKMGDLTAKSASGVRAQAWSRDGSLVDDFAVDQLGDVTVLRNAPSPAATSAMAIADYLIANYLPE